MPIYPPTPENCARLQRPDRHSNVPEGFPTLLRGVIGSQKGLYCAALCGEPAIRIIHSIYRCVRQVPFLPPCGLCIHARLVTDLSQLKRACHCNRPMQPTQTAACGKVLKKHFCAGHVDHYQYNNGDHSWSCGWRNIQMTSSHIVSNKVG